MNRFTVAVAVIDWRKLMPFLSRIKTISGTRYVRFVSWIYFHRIHDVQVWEMKCFPPSSTTASDWKWALYQRFFLNNMPQTMSPIFARIKGKIAPRRKGDIPFPNPQPTSQNEHLMKLLYHLCWEGNIPFGQVLTFCHWFLWYLIVSRSNR